MTCLPLYWSTNILKLFLQIIPPMNEHNKIYGGIKNLEIEDTKYDVTESCKPEVKALRREGFFQRAICSLTEYP